MTPRRRARGPRFAKLVAGDAAPRRVACDPALWKRVRAEVNLQHPHEPLVRRVARSVQAYEQQGGTWEE